MENKGNTGENAEYLKTQSWQEVLDIYREAITTVNGKDHAPLLRIVEALTQRGVDKEFFASQSLLRLVVSLSKDWPRPHGTRGSP